MKKSIIKLILKSINSRNYTDPKLIEWSKNGHNDRLLLLLTHFFKPSENIQTNIITDAINKELQIKIATRETQEKIYIKKIIRGFCIGASSAAAVAVILFMIITKVTDKNNEFIHNISVMYNNQSATILSDGTKVILRPGSNIKYDDFETNDHRVVKLDGEAYFDVVKSEKDFIVVVGDSKIKVLGTKFNVKANVYDNFIETILISGSVDFQYKSSTMDYKSVVMSPNEQLIFDKQTKQYTLTENHKPQEYIINDEYKFDDVPLSEVFKVISDIYELNIIIKDEQIKTIRYTGVIRRSHTFTSTMKILSEAVSLNYDMNVKGLVTIKLGTNNNREK